MSQWVWRTHWVKDLEAETGISNPLLNFANQNRAPRSCPQGAISFLRQKSLSIIPLV